MVDELDARTSLSMSNIDATEINECGICLGTDAECSLTANLPCGLRFCEPCLHRHVVSELLKRRTAWCPMCRQPISDEAVEQACPGAVGEVHDRSGNGDTDSAAVPTATWMERRMEAYRFRRVARRAHLKYCPRCRAGIEKNHGCNHMTCHCGHQFDWDAAETVATCHRLHRGSKFFIWGSTCPGCSALAKVKLAALRTTLVVGAIPAAVLAAPVVGTIWAGKKARNSIQRSRERRLLLDRQAREYGVEYVNYSEAFGHCW